MSAQDEKQAREKLAEALRSGEYRQGRTLLHPDDGTMCCLGVACDVFRKETGRGEWEEDGGDGVGGKRFRVSPTQSDVSVLPSAVQRWLGLADDFGSLTCEGEKMFERDGEEGPEFPTSLTELNDDFGGTFEQIAELLESDKVKLLSSST